MIITIQRYIFMRKPLIDLTGQKFGRLTAISIADLPGRIKWLFKCDCGNEKIITVSELTRKTNRTESCGCLRNERVRAVRMIHGHAGNGSKRNCTTEYKIWLHMKSRCSNPDDPHFADYGGRGIKVCERWENSFSNFLSDMGNRPSKMHSIDRFPDNNGGYSPDNCRWATREEQSRNKRNNRIVSYKGKTMIDTDLAIILNMNPRSIVWYIKKGIPGVKLLN
jgi:hypothetical protein